MKIDARNQCANGVEATMIGLPFNFFSFLSHMSDCFNFVDQTLRAHVLVNLKMYLPLKLLQNFQVCHSFGFFHNSL